MNGRKIIHIDMDCFYAAIEIRDNPALQNKAVAVGGSANARGVLCTCNYIARKYGVKSAMATSYALKLCPQLLVLPVNMSKYKRASKNIQDIFRGYTDLVEPLALDEAYLDVTACTKHNGSATLIAEEIRHKIFTTEKLTASAGISCNKFLAKIASGWNKPDGIFVITPNQVSDFVKNLEVRHLFGVGKVTLDKMNSFNIKTCSDLQNFSLNELNNKFGKFGTSLYYQSHGIDNREVNPNRELKSMSVETTFIRDINKTEALLDKLNCLYPRLLERLAKMQEESIIKSIFIKIKFSNFTQTTAIKTTYTLSIDGFQSLILNKQSLFQEKGARLLGIGVSFKFSKKTFQDTLF